MGHKHLKNGGTAAAKNDLFVNIKVHRVERADMYSIYQPTLGTIGENNDWPVAMFLTPGGSPIEEAPAF